MPACQQAGHDIAQPVLIVWKQQAGHQGSQVPVWKQQEFDQGTQAVGVTVKLALHCQAAARSGNGVRRSPTPQRESGGGGGCALPDIASRHGMRAIMARNRAGAEVGSLDLVAAALQCAAQNM